MRFDMQFRGPQMQLYSDLGTNQTSGTINLVPFDHDDEHQRQFEASERRKKQNRIAQRNYRKFVHVIVIQSSCTLTILKGKKSAESLRNKLVRPLLRSHKGSIVDTTRPQRLEKIIEIKSR